MTTCLKRLRREKLNGRMAGGWCNMRDVIAEARNAGIKRRIALRQLREKYERQGLSGSRLDEAIWQSQRERRKATRRAVNRQTVTSQRIMATVERQRGFLRAARAARMLRSVLRVRASRPARTTCGAMRADSDYGSGDGCGDGSSDLPAYFKPSRTYFLKFQIKLTNRLFLPRSQGGYFGVSKGWCA